MKFTNFFSQNYHRDINIYMTARINCSHKDIREVLHAFEILHISSKFTAVCMYINSPSDFIFTRCTGIKLQINYRRRKIF